ncbi:MAG: trigger factor [Bacilli bacterium]|nr:trigger factor [Bacilli bacterium]
MSKNEKKISVKIEGKEWKECLDKSFNEAIKKVKIDGFRPGKAPKSVFLKKYGIQSLYNDAADKAVDMAYSKVLKDNKEDMMNIVAYPDIAVKSIDENEVLFEFTLTLKPEVKLGKYTDLGVKKEKVSVSKKEIEETLDSMRNRYAEDVIKEGKIVDGDIAVIDFEGFVNDEPFEGGKGTNYNLKIGSGSFIPGFEEQLIGSSSGDDVDVKVTFPSDYHAEDLKGKDALFKVHINEVKEVKLPDYDSEFFEDLAMDGVTNKEELEAKVKENIKNHKSNHAEDKYVNDLLEAASKNMEVDIPSVMIDEEVNRMIREYENHLKSQGIDLNTYYKFTNSDEESLKSQMRDEAEKRVKYRLMLEEISNKEKIEVSDDEASKEAEKLAKQYGVSKDEFLMNFGGIDLVKYDLKMRKAMDILKR